MAFNDFVMTELPLRPFTASDGSAGQVLVRSNNPMAARELVWVDQSTIAAPSPVIFSRANEDYVNIAKCQPVFAYSSSSVRRALATESSAAWKVIGLSINTVLQSGIGNFQGEGVLTATTAEWDAVTGDVGGLVPNKTYFLSSTQVGKITLVPPSNPGDYLCRIGVGHSSTSMYIDLGLCIKL